MPPRTKKVRVYKTRISIAFSRRDGLRTTFGGTGLSVEAEQRIGDLINYLTFDPKSKETA